MKITIKIQSFSDIITNSSSELFTIKTNMSARAFRDIWNRYLDKRGYNHYFGGYETYHGHIDEEEPGVLTLEYPDMCNLEREDYEWLEKLFGEENVSY